jgi:hypothetical protein
MLGIDDDDYRQAALEGLAEAPETSSFQGEAGAKRRAQTIE